MTRIGIVADDLTGATTVGALIAREGVEATVLFDHRAIADSVGGDEDVVIVSTDSRPMEPEVAFGRVRQATQALQKLGVERFSKRIDTTCRGGIGPEVEGMLTALGEDYVAIVVPAMPQSKRIVIGGYSLIDSVLLSRTDVAHDVRTPVTESHLPTLLRQQLTMPLGHIGIADVASGPAAVAARLEGLKREGARVFVVDAASLEDVETVARAAAGLNWPVVAVDPGPFTVAMAIESGALNTDVHAERGTRTEQRDDDDGTILVVAGSATTVTHHQMDALAQEPGTFPVPVDVLNVIGTNEAFEQERNRACTRVREAMCSPTPPRVVLLAFDTVLSGLITPTEQLEEASGLSGQNIASRLASRFGLLARAVLDQIGPDRCAGAYLTGGDTMINSCYAFGAHGLTLVDYVIPQVDQAKLIGGPYGGLSVVCKGGLTGSSETAIQSVNRLFDERKLVHVR